MPLLPLASSATGGDGFLNLQISGIYSTGFLASYLPVFNHAYDNYRGAMVEWSDEVAGRPGERVCRVDSGRDD